MKALFVLIIAVASTLLIATAAHGQSLAPNRTLVWPTEFENPIFGDFEERILSCNSFHAARPKYMAVSRPRYNCSPGIDCPNDLQEAAPETIEFVLYYMGVDLEQPKIDVEMAKTATDVVKAVVERLLRDIDRVARSKRRSIEIVAHTDTSGTAAQNQVISEILAQCIKDVVEVSIHLNGYAGAYDFPLRLDARGETQLARPTRDGVREPLNRRAEITVRY